MKCIKQENDIRRVTDDNAHKMVSEGRWAYCPKHEWKTATGRTKTVKTDSNAENNVENNEKPKKHTKKRTKKHTEPTKK